MEDLRLNIRDADTVKLICQVLKKSKNLETLTLGSAGNLNIYKLTY